MNRAEMTAEQLSSAELWDAWPVLAIEDRLAGFQLLARPEAEDFFFELSSHDQAQLVLALPESERRSWLRLLPPDDAADLLQQAPAEVRSTLASLLDAKTRIDVNALLAYAEDEAGGLMNPRYARVRPDMTVDEAIAYLRKEARERVANFYYVYVLDESHRLLGVVSLRELFAASPDKRVRDVMHTDLVTVRDNEDQESVSRAFAQHDLVSIPVVDAEGRMQGVVTIDDVVDVVEEEATEDIQKFGGMEALESPYLETGFAKMVRKRVGWLAVLFLGGLLTATAMSHFEDDIAKAVVLALFVPLVISSGGNSGSQASTLVIRAMALEEVRLRDWWRVVRRELAAGLVLGGILGAMGFARIAVWEGLTHAYGPGWMGVALTVFVSLLGVVTFGTLVGSALPFFFRRLGVDPASASAPFVATMVDVTGLVIYFSVAAVFLSGTLLK